MSFYPRIGVEIFEAQSTLEPVISDEGEYRLELFIQADGRIQDQLCPTDYVWDGELVSSLNQCLTTVIRNEVKDSWSRHRN